MSGGIRRRELLAGVAGLSTPMLVPGVAAAQTPGGPPPLRAGSLAPASRFTWPVRRLLQPDLSRALDTKVRLKTPSASLLIDDMETDRGWTASSTVKLSYTTERSKSGSRSLRFETEQRNLDYIAASRAKNGSFTGGGPLFDFAPFAAWARLDFAAPQDWSDFNRLSLWCYLHPTGNPISSICLQFVCAGALAGPTDPVAIHYIGDLREGEWNLLTWEISEYQRDRVTGVEIFQPVFGLPFPNLPSRLTYDLDDLRVDRVEVEQVQGWSVAPGKFAFSHVGYGDAAPKIAVGAAGLSSAVEVIDAETSNVVATFAAQPAKTRVGAFSVCDFSALTRPGRYRLRCEAVESGAFDVAKQPWRPLVEAALNAVYGLRCGFAVPGAHAACHCDLYVKHNGETRIVGGGWHDAANLAQDPNNTAVMACSLLDLAQALAPVDAELSARALEEAKWGLEWIARMRFGPGLRYLMGGYSYFTDGIPGTIDDIVQENVGSNTFKNLVCALAEVRGAQALRRSDPAFAGELLRAAKEDFATVVADRPQPPTEPPGEPKWNIVPWQNEAGYMALTAVELYRATGDHSYADQAAQFARWTLAVQEFRFVEGAPVTGYFYEDAARTRIIHEYQRTSGAPNSFEEGAPLAYQALCEAFPDHPDWIEWYAGLVAFSEYFCRKGAEASAPFDVVPAAVWREQDLSAPFSRDFLSHFPGFKPGAIFPTQPRDDLIKGQMRAMYEAGTYLSPSQRLRVLPIWVDHVRHGATCVHLTKSIGLAAAAQVRKQVGLSDLHARQIQWEVGANPLSRSIVHGVGYDWWQNFTVSNPNLVGGVPVGMNSYGGDAPAWGNNAVFPYKEIWILSSARLAANLARAPGVARVEGVAPAGARFVRKGTGEVFEVAAGRFARALPVGVYDVTCGGFSRTVALADGARQALDLDPKTAVEITVEDEDAHLAVTVRGRGAHRIELRASNLMLETPRLDVDLAGGDPKTIRVGYRISDAERPWVVVAVPDGRTAEGVERIGAALTFAPLSQPR